MSAFEQSVLSDDLLDEAEYELAFNLYRACVLESGGRFEPEAQKNARGTWNFGVHVPPLRPGLSNDEAILGVENCSAQYFDAVHERWTAEHLPLHAEVEAAKAGIVQCMRDRGIEMPEDLPDGWGQAYFGKPAPAGLRTDREAGQAFADCSRAAAAALGYGTDGGLAP